jgi:hypothetical protein
VVGADFRKGIRGLDSGSSQVRVILCGVASGIVNRDREGTHEMQATAKKQVDWMTDQDRSEVKL